MTPSERFKQLRKALGMRQVDAAKFLGISERGVQKIEAGIDKTYTLKSLNGKLLRENLRIMPKKDAINAYDEIDKSISEVNK